ncbi:MAG: TrkH family potassium uptake protein, partial [Vulcanimicrobiota bacterium]
GLTIVNAEKTSHVILMWRSLTQYIGSAGFAVVMLSVLTGPSAAGIYQAEGHYDIMPHVKQSAKLVVKIYLFFLLTGSIAYVIVGMPVFDSINHCMAALGTGGFSTRNASIGAYNSLPIEMVTLVLMILGGTSFAVHHFASQGKWKTVFKNAEVRTFITTLLIFIVLTIFSIKTFYGSSWESIRKGVFEITSSLTGTGFSIVKSYAMWPQLGLLLSVLAMCAGGMTNSTSGAIKQLRIYMMVKSIWWTIERQFLPQTTVIVDYIYKGEDKTYIDSKSIRDVFNYISVYVITLVIGTCILMAYGFPMHESMFEFASAQGCVGQSIGITAYNAPSGVLTTLMIGMFLGRLEFFIIFYGFMKVFRDVIYLARNRDLK